MYEYVTEWLDPSIENKRFVLREGARISKEYDTLILSDKKRIALARRVSPDVFREYKGYPKIVLDKLKESNEIAKKINRGIKNLWIYKKNTSNL